MDTLFIAVVDIERTSYGSDDPPTVETVTVPVMASDQEQACSICTAVLDDSEPYSTLTMVTVRSIQKTITMQDAVQARVHRSHR
jgi:hypothetical protein